MTGLAAVPRERILDRLNALREEETAGLKVMGEIQARAQEMQATLSRISGAILVLEQLLAEPDPPAESLAPSPSP